MATSTSWSTTSLISRASRSSIAASIPRPPSPASASPLNLMSTRLYAGVQVTAPALLSAEFVASEPAHLHVLLELRCHLRHQIVDRLLRVLDVRLTEQRHFLRVLVRPCR